MKSIPLKTKLANEVSDALFAGGLLRSKVTGSMERSEMTWQLNRATRKYSLEQREILGEGRKEISLKTRGTSYARDNMRP